MSSCGSVMKLVEVNCCEEVGCGGMLDLVVEFVVSKCWFGFVEVVM